MNWTLKRAEEILQMKPQAIMRAIALGAIVTNPDGLTISDDELRAFIHLGFKNHRYDEQGNKLEGVKS